MKPTKRLHLDLETYSACDLKKSGVYKYAEHETTRVLLAAYAIDDDPVEVLYADDDEAERKLLEKLVTLGLTGNRVEKAAHNANFERIVLTGRLRARGLFNASDGVMLPSDWWYDTMALAALAGYPRSLMGWTKAVGSAPKDSAGSDLIRWFSVPNRKGVRRPMTGDRRTEDWVRYCRQDVEAMRDAIGKTIELCGGKDPLEGHERWVWRADQEINDVGIKVDTRLAKAAVAADERIRGRAMGKARTLIELTGPDPRPASAVKKGDPINPASINQLMSWLKAQGVGMDDLRETSVDDALADPELPPHVRAVLEARAEAGGAASKKFAAMLARVSSDGRLRGGLMYGAAHTLRWGGRGLQMQNLPRAGFKTETEELEGLKRILGHSDDMTALDLKKAVRPSLVGPFTVVDYSAIEARVLAWLAGEEWVLQAFRDGRDIYVETGKMMGGLDRFHGKVATLALGYGGGIGALRVMGGAALGDDDKLASLRDAWRASSQATVQWWSTLEDAWRNGGPAGKRIHVEPHGEDRAVVLPSGRRLWYRGCGVMHREDDYGRPVQRLSYIDPSRGRIETYGGRLTENVVQAVARDVLAAALVNLTGQGYRVVGHVHDEVLIEGDEGVEEIAEIMCSVGQSPGDASWAEGLPLAAAGYQCKRYRKG